MWCCFVAMPLTVAPWMVMLVDFAKQKNQIILLRTCQEFSSLHEIQYVLYRYFRYVQLGISYQAEKSGG